MPLDRWPARIRICQRGASHIAGGSWLLRRAISVLRAFFVQPSRQEVGFEDIGRQLFEYGFGLEAGATTGEVADKPGTIERGGCFGALRDVYISNGRPFRGLEMGAGGVDWKAGNGVYVLCRKMASKHCRRAKQPVQMVRARSRRWPHCRSPAELRRPNLR